MSTQLMIDFKFSSIQFKSNQMINRERRRRFRRVIRRSAATSAAGRRPTKREHQKYIPVMQKRAVVFSLLFFRQKFRVRAAAYPEVVVRWYAKSASCTSIPEQLPEHTKCSPSSVQYRFCIGLINTHEAINHLGRTPNDRAGGDNK
jgi:hypothetical protein